MWSWFASIAIVMGGLVGGASLFQWSRRRSRAAAVRIAGQPMLRQARDVSVQLTVDGTAPRGLRAGQRYRSPGHLLLAGDRLVLATNQGRVLELSAEKPGTLRTPGPRMMIIEGEHPSGRARVRAELVIDKEQEWAAAVRAQLRI